MDLLFHWYLDLGKSVPDTVIAYADFCGLDIPVVVCFRLCRDSWEDTNVIDTVTI